MTKQELAKATRIMYDLKMSCEHLHSCVGCYAYNGTICVAKLINGNIPMKWNIKEKDVLQLEREAKFGE